MPNKDSEQKNYLELQLMVSHIQQLQEQFNLVSNQINELSSQIEYLGEFEEVKPNSRLFAQVLPGIFIKANLEDKDSVAINVGSNVIVKKSINGAKQLLSSKLEELREVNTNIKEQILLLIKDLEDKQQPLE